MNTSNDTSDDHDLVGEDKDDDLSNGEASKKSKVEEEERGGKGPVEICLHGREQRKKAKEK